MIWLVFFISILIVLAIAFYINARLFVYIKGLESKLQEAIDKNDNMFQSLKELVQDDFLLSDGRLKKFVYKKDHNRFYNGIKIEDNEVEI